MQLVIEYVIINYKVKQYNKLKGLIVVSNVNEIVGRGEFEYSKADVVDLLVSLSAYIKQKDLAEMLGMSIVKLNKLTNCKHELDGERTEALGRRLTILLEEFKKRDVMAVWDKLD